MNWRIWIRKILDPPAPDPVIISTDPSINKQNNKEKTSISRVLRLLKNLNLDPAPYQNATDPEDWKIGFFAYLTLGHAGDNSEGEAETQEVGPVRLHIV